MSLQAVSPIGSVSSSMTMTRSCAGWTLCIARWPLPHAGDEDGGEREGCDHRRRAQTGRDRHGPGCCPSFPASTRRRAFLPYFRSLESSSCRVRYLGTHVFGAGARGYVLKESAGAERAVRPYWRWSPENVISAPRITGAASSTHCSRTSQPRARSRLSPREREVLHLTSPALRARRSVRSCRCHARQWTGYSKPGDGNTPAFRISRVSSASPVRRTR